MAQDQRELGFQARLTKGRAHKLRESARLFQLGAEPGRLRYADAGFWRHITHEELRGKKALLEGVYNSRRGFVLLPEPILDAVDDVAIEHGLDASEVIVRILVMHLMRDRDSNEARELSRKYSEEYERHPPDDFPPPELGRRTIAGG